MPTNHYLKFILTVIALELCWLAIDGRLAPVSAQGAATPVVITGIQLAQGSDGIPVVVQGVVSVQARGVVKVEADQPLPVAAVPYTPSQRPGE